MKIEKTAELASKKAALRALEFVQDFTGLNKVDSYAFLAQFCDLKIAQIVNPFLKTIYMEIDKNL